MRRTRVSGKDITPSDTRSKTTTGGEESKENSSVKTNVPSEYTRMFVGYTIGTSFCVVLTILTLRTMVTQMGSDLVSTNHAFTDWCSKYEDSSFCRRSHTNESHDIIPAPQHGSVYQRLESLELGYLRIQEKILEQSHNIISMEERLRKLERLHDTSAVEQLKRVLGSLQFSTRSMSSRLDSELVSIAKDIESISERMHRVENHVFVSEDLHDD